MSDLTRGFLGLLLPTLIAGAILALGWWRHRKAEEPDAVAGPRWLGGIAVVAGYLVAHALIAGRPELPPVEAEGWLFWLALPMVALGAIDALLTIPGWIRGQVALLLFALALVLLLRPVIDYTWEARGEAFLWMVGLTLGLFLFWLALDAIAERARGPDAALVIAIVALGLMASVIILGGSAKYGQLALAIAGACGAGAIVGVRVPALTYARGVPPVAALLLGGQIVAGKVYADMPLICAALLAAAPFAAFAGDIPRIRERGGWPRTAVRAGAVAVVVGAALVVGLLLREPADDLPY